jgi:hypothetical protein
MITMTITAISVVDIPRCLETFNFTLAMGCPDFNVSHAGHESEKGQNNLIPALLALQQVQDRSWVRYDQRQGTGCGATS